MELIDGILGSSLSGRLFIKVRDQLGRAYTLGTSYIPGPDMGVFVIHVLTTPDKVEDVKAILKQELISLQSTPVNANELKSVQEHLKGNFKMSLDTPAALASECAFDELYGLGYNFSQHYAQAIDAVSSADVQKAAEKYLDFNKAAIVVTMPKKKVE
jgi:zinc protease